MHKGIAVVSYNNGNLIKKPCYLASIDILWYRFVNLSYRASSELGQLSDSYSELCKEHTLDCICTDQKYSICHPITIYTQFIVNIHFVLRSPIPVNSGDAPTFISHPYYTVTMLFTSNLALNWQWSKKYQTIIILQSTSSHNGQFVQKLLFRWASIKYKVTGNFDSYNFFSFSIFHFSRRLNSIENILIKNET